MKIKVHCTNCNKEMEVYPSRAKKSDKLFCNKSCHRSYKNKVDNPSKHRDLSGKNNPMYGVSKPAWNKGLVGENSHNWRGGLHKRKDGYYRINIGGKRYLYHRYVLGIHNIDDYVVHHIDHNPSNNNKNNLMVFRTQEDHVRYEKDELNTMAKRSGNRQS